MRLLHARHDHGGTDLLSRNINPSEAEIRHQLEGNLCRCTGYQHIIKAVQHAAEKMRAIGGKSAA
jgi:aerobic-type carbon monoxide dehydrogenase small subunit (CoxS/CutS family)